MSDCPPVSAPWWLWPNLLAVDAPLVAVVWQRFLADCLGLALPGAPSACLGLVVWGVYLVDRGLDAGPGRPADPADRHAFARRHRRPLLAVGGLAVAAGAALGVAVLPAAGVRGGLAVGAALAAYLGWVHLAPGGLRPGKEVAVGLVFAAGVAVPLLTRAADRAAEWGPAVGGFAAVCWLNCRLIDGWERGRPGLSGGSAVAAALALLAAPWGPPAAGAASAAAVGLLLLLHAGRRRAGPRAGRVLADAALLTPLGAWP